jgi:hypothetical protein
METPGRDGAHSEEEVRRYTPGHTPERNADLFCPQVNDEVLKVGSDIVEKRPMHLCRELILGKQGTYVSLTFRFFPLTRPNDHFRCWNFNDCERWRTALLDASLVSIAPGAKEEICPEPPFPFRDPCHRHLALSPAARTPPRLSLQPRLLDIPFHQLIPQHRHRLKFPRPRKGVLRNAMFKLSSCGLTGLIPNPCDSTKSLLAPLMSIS